MLLKNNRQFSNNARDMSIYISKCLDFFDINVVNVDAYNNSTFLKMIRIQEDTLEACFYNYILLFLIFYPNFIYSIISSKIKKKGTLKNVYPSRVDLTFDDSNKYQVHRLYDEVV